MSTLRRRRRRKSIPIKTKTKHRWRIYHGDMLRVLRRRYKLNHRLFDAVITDPPYNLVSIVKRFGKKNSAPVKVKEFFNGKKSKGSSPYLRSSAGFMGKKWDNQIAFQVQTWRRVYNCLKPGAYVIAMGGTRTSHRMTCAIEDAGFIIRDTFMWLHGQGFPKSHNISKAIDKKFGGKYKKLPANGVGFMKPKGNNGWNPTKHRLVRKSKLNKIARKWRGYGTAVKPAFEPIIIAQKPIEGTIAANVLKHGTGGINIDASRIIGTPETTRFNPAKHSHNGWRMTATGKETAANISVNGRWPANIIHDGSPELLEIFARFGIKKTIGKTYSYKNKTYQEKGFIANIKSDAPYNYGDNGSVARFFYTAKAAKREKIFHCQHCGRTFAPLKIPRHHHNKLNPKGKPDFSHITAHPTVKPLALMKYLVTLFTPPNGRVLDPFAGSGTTLQAAAELGFRAIGIEQEREYIKHIKRRMRNAGF